MKSYGSFPQKKMLLNKTSEYLLILTFQVSLFNFIDDIFSGSQTFSQALGKLRGLRCCAHSMGKTKLLCTGS